MGLGHAGVAEGRVANRPDLSGRLGVAKQFSAGLLARSGAIDFSYWLAGLLDRFLRRW